MDSLKSVKRGLMKLHFRWSTTMTRFLFCISSTIYTQKKSYYYLVKLDKPNMLVEMMENVQKFAYTEDGDDEED